MFGPKPPPPTLIVETRGRSYHVEPTLLEAPATWGHPRLVQRSPDLLELLPDVPNCLRGVFIGVGLPVVFWLITWRMLADPHLGPDLKTPVEHPVVLVILQLAAVGCVALGLALLTWRFRIDRGAGEVRRAWFLRDHVLCRTGDVVAVQAVRGFIGRQEFCQLNLVLASSVRINLVPNDSGATQGPHVLWFGRRLAMFLGVPLVDQIGGMAVLGQTQLAGFFAPDWVAGPLSAELTETGAGVLELRPVARRDSPPGDQWGGGLAHAPCASVKFDRNRGRRPRLFVHTSSGSGRVAEAIRKTRPLEDVIAVELTADVDDRPADLAAIGPTCRLRLLLRDASCPVLELAPHADEAWARRTGERLAQFLGVPLEDRIGPERS